MMRIERLILGGGMSAVLLASGCGLNTLSPDQIGGDDTAISTTGDSGQSHATDTGVAPNDDSGNMSGDDSGGSTTPSLAFSSTFLDFGVVDIGSSESQTLTVTNHGTEGVLLQDITSSDPTYSGVFSATPPLVLFPGENIDITVTYAPTSETTNTGTLTVSTDDPASPDYEIDVTGKGEDLCSICQPVIKVGTGGTDDHSASLTDLISCTISATLTIQNQGDEDLEVRSVTVKNDTVSTCGTFSVSWAGAPLTLGPLDTSPVTLTYTATQTCIEFGSAALDSNVLHIKSNDPTEPDYVIELSAYAGCLF